MRYPWANSLLFLFLGLELLTGFFGLISGSEDRSIYLQLHRIGGYGIVAVLVWKTVNVAMSLKWRRSGPVRTASLVLTGLLVATLVLGFVWSWTGPYSWWLFSGVSWHIYVGVALVPLLVWHWRHMGRPARKGFSVERREFLRIAGLAVAGFVAWQASEGLVRAADFSGKSRRFTGSYEAGSFTGNDFPQGLLVERRPRPHRCRDVDGRGARVCGEAGSPDPRRPHGGRPRHGHVGLHRRVALDPGMVGRFARRRSGLGGSHRIGQERGGPVGHRILQAVFPQRRPRIPPGDRRRRRTVVPRPRRAGASRCAGTPRIRVGQVGRRNRNQRRPRLVAVAAPRRIGVKQLSGGGYTRLGL